MKKVAHNIYIHRSALDTLSESYQKIVNEAAQYLPEEFQEYVVFKLDEKDLSVSFIKSFDWDTANEPAVGDSCKIKDGKTTIVREKGQIYHNKWQFVKLDYQGFDVEEAKRRSELWQSMIPQTREVKTRIGYRKYWNALLDRYNIAI